MPGWHIYYHRLGTRTLVPPKKKARMVTSTPVMSGKKQRGSATDKDRGGKGRGGRVGGGTRVLVPGHQNSGALSS